MTLPLLLALATGLPEGPGKAAVLKSCGSCHPAEVVVGTNNTRKGWTELVDEMIFKGAKVTAREKREIIDYLSRNFPMRL